MATLTNHAAFSGYVYSKLLASASLAGEETDGMKLLQLLAGIMVETVLLFEDSDEGLVASYDQLAQMLECEPLGGTIAPQALPPAYIIDYETEQGRGICRVLFEDWLDCAYEFHSLMISVIHNVIVKLEAEGQPRQEVFRVFIDCLNKAMAYEISAQELCDIVIDEKVAIEKWSMCQSVSGLSALSGHYLAQSQNACQIFSGPLLPDKLDQVSYVMTQEAVRLGIPAGSDWRFGLAANDCAVSAPHDLLSSLGPRCEEFFRVIKLNSRVDRAVACAKAAGRMLAVAAGGEMPELEPAIAKPLAMAAMTDTYKVACSQGLRASV